jgi:isoleucyl-tRNA synthetase
LSFANYSQYPLPEVIVILREQESLDELRTMERYILEELNVRALNLTTDKDSFGVSLRAEPNHRIGARLKGQFKAVMAEIKVFYCLMCLIFTVTK